MRFVWTLPAARSRLVAARAPAARGGRTLTVKRLERRLDCFRTGVGVLAGGGTSMRSSFWLVLGVDGTDEE